MRECHFLLVLLAIAFLLRTSAIEASFIAFGLSSVALTGRSLPLFVTQGVATLALDYVLTVPAGRSVPTFIKRVVG